MMVFWERMMMMVFCGENDDGVLERMMMVFWGENDDGVCGEND